jgi:hypothetical protein
MNCLVCADDINILGISININIIKKHTEAPLDADKEVGLEVNAEKTMYTAFLPPECRSESI